MFQFWDNPVPPIGCWRVRDPYSALTDSSSKLHPKIWLNSRIVPFSQKWGMVVVTLRAFLASFLSGMSVGGSETRAWELVKEGPCWGGGGLVARQPTGQSKMLIGLWELKSETWLLIKYPHKHVSGLRFMFPTQMRFILITDVYIYADTDDHCTF